MESDIYKDNLLEARNIKLSKRVIDQIRRVIGESESIDDLTTNSDFNALLRNQIPTLFTLARQIRRKILKGSPFVLVKGLPFIEYGDKVRDFLFLGLTSGIGETTATDVVQKRVIWPVTPRQYLAYSDRTITERAGAAELHTDSSYRNYPERYVAFFMVHPASDGGITEIVDGRETIRSIAQRPNGTKCLRALSSLDYPFRVPTAFTRTRSESSWECITAPVVSNLLRFRYDLIADGFRCMPASLTDERSWAIDFFRKHLDASEKHSLCLRTGEILILDNFNTLHGRTAFTDITRLLLRVRINERSKFVYGQSPKTFAA